MNELALRTPGPNGGYNINAVAGMPSGGLSDLQSIVSWATTTLMIAAVILTVVFFILGGIQWITSSGNKEKIQAAQKKITYAAIGLVITLGAFFIVNIVGWLLGVSFF